MQENASNILYREDYEFEKDQIYYMPGENNQSKINSDLQYKKKFEDSKKTHKFNACDTIQYNDQKKKHALGWGFENCTWILVWWSKDATKTLDLTLVSYFLKPLRKDLNYQKDWEESKHKLQSTTESVESERVKQANQLRSDRLYKQQGQGTGWDMKKSA